MEIKINIKKRHLYIFAGLIGILIGVLVVNAVVPNPGHAPSEIDWSQIINGIRIRNINFSYGNYNDAANPNEFTRFVSSQGNVGGIMHSRTGTYGTNSLVLFSYGNRDIVLRPEGTGNVVIPNGIIEGPAWVGYKFVSHGSSLTCSMTTLGITSTHSVGVNNGRVEIRLQLSPGGYDSGWLNQLAVSSVSGGVTFSTTANTAGNPSLEGRAQTSFSSPICTDNW